MKYLWIIILIGIWFGHAWADYIPNQDGTVTITTNSQINPIDILRRQDAITRQISDLQSTISSLIQENQQITQTLKDPNVNSLLTNEEKNQFPSGGSKEQINGNPG